MKRIFTIIFIIYSVVSSMACMHCHANPKHIPLSGNDEGLSPKKYNTKKSLESFLKLSSFKQAVISQNIANLHTANYKAQAVKMPKKLSDLVTHHIGKEIGFKRTSSKHLSGITETESKFKAHKLRNPEEIKKNGNTVSLTQQMMESSKNKNHTTLALKAYDSLYNLEKLTLGK